MLLSTGSFQVLFLIQTFVQLPFVVNVKKNRLEKFQLDFSTLKIKYKIFSENFNIIWYFSIGSRSDIMAYISLEMLHT